MWHIEILNALWLRLVLTVVVFLFHLPSWSTTPKREILMRRRWKWPVFGWRYVSKVLFILVKVQSVHLWMWNGVHEVKFVSASSLQEKDLVPKLFKVIAPRFESQPGGYTRMARIPNRKNLDRAKMAVLEYKGNPFPALYPVRKENELTLINQLLKGFREERAQQLAAKAWLMPSCCWINDFWRVMKCFWCCRLWLKKRLMHFFTKGTV